jgi:hypothetical protein
MVGFFLREWSSEIDGLIAAARHIRGAVERQHRRRQRRNDGDQRPTAGSTVELRVVCDPEVSGRQYELTAVSILLRNRGVALISVCAMAASLMRGSKKRASCP